MLRYLIMFIEWKNLYFDIRTVDARGFIWLMRTKLKVNA
jgi:hypothetical protein